MITMYMCPHPKGKPVRGYDRRVILPDGKEYFGSPDTQFDYTLLKPFLGDLVKLVYETVPNVTRDTEYMRLVDVVLVEGVPTPAITDTKDWAMTLKKSNKLKIYLNKEYINLKNGNVYTVLAESKHSENGDLYITYVNRDGESYVRPKWLFIRKFRLVGGEPYGLH